jgi:glycosyltransferase involved in cell wall biosynthesis
MMAPEADSRRSRVLFVSNLFPDSASTYRGLDNATLLHKLRDFFDVKVISPRPSLSPRRWLGFGSPVLRPREMDRVLDPDFIEVPYVPCLGTPFNHLLMRMCMSRSIHRLVNGAGFDAIVCSWLYPDGCAVSTIARKLDVPLVLITQGTDTHHYINFPMRKRVILSAIEKSCAVISRSIELGRLLTDAGADPGKIYPVHNGVDESIFYPRDKILSRKLLGLSDKERLIVFVGNFLPVKNPEFLIKAFSEAAVGKEVRLAMIGRGPMKSGLEKLSVKLGIADRVIFTGPLDSGDVAEWMGAADCLCLCSHNEGLPNVLLEALASGLTVVSSDVGGIGELLSREGRGILVEPEDMKGYVDALVSIMESGQAEPVVSNERSGFSWSKCALKHAWVINHILQSRGKSDGYAGKTLENVCSLLELEKQ